MPREESAFRVLSLADDEPLLVEDGALQWIPLRRRLGIRAFGTNAYRAASAGDLVIEDHVESPGQEELYVVVAGGVRFTVGDEEVEAKAGTVVFLPQPEVRRGGVATEDGTIVLAVGGWPDRPYHSLPWEPIFMAADATRRGDWAEAAAILEREAGEHLDAAVVQFRLACFHAQAGAHARALSALHRAIEIDSSYRARAQDEELLVPLREIEGWPGA
jgi:hypothetical protein